MPPNPTPPWGRAEALALAERWQRECAHQAMPENFFLLAHALVRFLQREGCAEAALALLRAERTMGVERFLGVRLTHAALLAQALLDAGSLEAAQEIVAYYCARPYLFDDMGKMGDFVVIRASQALHDHDSMAFAHCLTLLTETEAGVRHANFIRLLHAVGGVRPLMQAAGAHAPFGTRMSVRLLGFAVWLSRHGVVAGVLGRGVHVALAVGRALWRIRGGNQTGLLPRERESGGSTVHGKAKGPIVVARALGGLGDILMMTPGLRALARKYPQHEVWFALPKGLMPVVQGLPFAKVVDIDGLALTQNTCAALYNLTDCPARQVERASLPHVTQNRIDSFARAMGVSAHDLDACGRQLWYAVSPEEAAEARAFLATVDCAPGSFVAMQPLSTDPYKNYGGMEELARKLAATKKVLVMHDRPFAGYEEKNIIKIYDRSVRQTMAILSMSAQIVSNDSFFVHAGAALRVKTLAIYGPTDGRIFTKYYATVTTVCMEERISCTPCWRNAEIVCFQNTCTQSACLQCQKNFSL